MTTVIAASPEIRGKIRDFKNRINEAEAAVLKSPSEANLARLTDVLEESKRFREGLHG